jgi:iron(III) transport system ATP-binding protein
MACEAVCAHHVSKRFGSVQAVAQASLCLEPGEFLALLGPSGCGKTTLLRLMAGFEVPDEGEIRLEGRTVADRRSWVPPERRRVGMVFQDYALFPHLTVAENVGFGVPRRQRRRRVPALLDLVGLTALGARYPHELSGGQQQRVALARALAPQPAIVLLDEPWSNIDPLLRHTMRDGLADILRTAGVTTILVTHDREEAFSIADRIAVMRRGAVVQSGAAEDVYFNPADRWTAEFIGAGNFVPGSADGDLVETLLGRFRVANGACSGRVHALIRPELLELRPDPTGPAEVVGREFRGHDVFYRLRLDGDGAGTLVSQRPSTEVVRLGQRVSVHPHEVSVPVFAE